MFRQVCKSTLKNLFRSGAFWFMVLIFGGIAVYYALVGFKGVIIVHPITGAMKTVHDSSPEFTLNYDIYIQFIYNCVYRLMHYAIPIISILSTVLILNHDYGDNFYEIEKSSGIKPSAYLFGRITALIAVNLALIIICSFASFHTYVISRGGLSMVGTVCYITDSSVRLIRIIVFYAFPIVLFYVGITYLLGCVFHSGLFASIGSISYVIFNLIYVIFPFLKRIIPVIFSDYFSSWPQKVSAYLYWYDTYAFNPNLSLREATFAFLFQPSAFLMMLIISYIFIKKRDN